MTSMTVKTPWHLWVVGGISLLWNGYGAFDFVMTTLQGEAYMRASGFEQPMIDYYAAMPNWMYVPWVLGVWGGLLAAILLLIRNKLAAPVFGLSLLGAVGSLVFGLINPMPELPEAMAMMTYLPWFIAALAAFQTWYAWSMSKAGVLR